MTLEYTHPAFASWTKRVAASVLDGAIGSGVTFLVFGDNAMTLPFVGTSFQPSDAQGLPLTSWTDSSWVVGVVLLMVGMQAYLGATPGKLVMGIAVVRDSDARPVGLMRTIVRWFAHILDSILFIGYLRPLWNPQRRTFADSIMATVVLDTRRPRRHPWLVRGDSSLLDTGPPFSWVAPAAPRWWRAATALSAVACLLGVLFSFSPSSGEAAGSFDLTCEMTARDSDPLGLTGGSLRYSSLNETTTRLGVTRDVRGPGRQTTASWQWSAPQPLAPGLTLRTTFTRADGTGARHYDFIAQDGATHEATFTLPADAMKDLGDSWTWIQTVVVDGVESSACTASVMG